MYRFISLFVVVISLLLAGCSSNSGSSGSDPSAPAELAVSVSNLTFNPADQTLTFQIENDGGTRLSWDISLDSNWLACTPNSGTTEAGSNTTITVTVDRAGLSVGIYYGTITVDAGDLSETVNVQLEVASPELFVNLSELTFSANANDLVFEIQNVGGGELTWTVTSPETWITASPNTGTTTVETDPVTVTLDRSTIDAGYYERTLTVESNAGNYTIDLSISVGEMIWSEDFEDPGPYSTRWEAFDAEDDLIAGEDYWGRSVDDAYEGVVSVFCAENGNPNPGEYSNWMEAWLRLKSDQSISIASYDDVSIRFWMKYDTEFNDDFVRFLVYGTNGNWYYTDDNSWSGTDYSWRQYEIHLSDYEFASSTSLRFGFLFDSDSAVVARGVYIDMVEVWGK